MKKRIILYAIAFAAIGIPVLQACNKTDDVTVEPTVGNNSGSGTSDPTDNNGTVGDGVPDVYKKIYGAKDMYVDGDFLVVTIDGLPDHKSPYYMDTEWESTMYEDYNGSNGAFHLNPNRISESSITIRLPLNPAEATNKQSTPLGPIGVALNGVPFYNQYAAGNAPLTNEINSFDQYNGHPQQMGGYHYHIEPLFLTAAKGKSALMGFLADGFPVYGPEENGTLITSSQLDDYHGHYGVTEDYPDGIYHYHLSADAPYLNGDGYYGAAGTITQ